MLPFLADENFPLPSVRLLQAAGHPVTLPQRGEADTEILRRIAAREIVLLTLDKDFGDLIFRDARLSPAGVVLFRYLPATPEEPAVRLLRMLQRGVVLPGFFTVVQTGRTRQRKLPG